MIRLLRSRRGQIRGIDFSLAMIIFLLVMSQILVLTNTFIDSSRSSQETELEQNASNSLANSFLESTGYSGTLTDWHDATTASLVASDWTFGLAGDQAIIDPFKLSRLANNSDPDYLLDYTTVKDATNSSQEFMIHVDTAIDISIENYQINGNSFRVNGTVSYNNLQLENSATWVFLAGDDLSSGNVIEAYDNTNGQGVYDVILNDPFVSTTSFFVLIVITKYGTTGQSITTQVISQGSTPTRADITLLNVADTSLGYAVQVSTDMVTPDFLSVYASPGTSNYSIVLSGAGNDIPVPEKGMAAILAISGTDIALTSFPLLMNDELSTALGPASTPVTQSSVTQVNRLVRGVLLEFSITLWS